MNYNQYRTYHYDTYGPSSRQVLSKNWITYKKTGVKSPIKNKGKSPVRTLIKSPVKSKVKYAPSFKSDVKNVKPVKTGNLLTMKDIENMAKNKKFLIIVLYANFCSHCRDMKEKLGNKFKNTDKIKFYEEATLDDSLKEYYPHILYYEDGEQKEDLTADNLYSYLL